MCSWTVWEEKKPSFAKKKLHNIRRKRNSIFSVIYCCILWWKCCPVQVWLAGLNLLLNNDGFVWPLGVFHLRFHENHRQVSLRFLPLTVFAPQIYTLSTHHPISKSCRPHKLLPHTLNKHFFKPLRPKEVLFFKTWKMAGHSFEVYIFSSRVYFFYLICFTNLPPSVCFLVFLLLFSICVLSEEPRIS